MKYLLILNVIFLSNSLFPKGFKSISLGQTYGVNLDQGSNQESTSLRANYLVRDNFEVIGVIQRQSRWEQSGLQYGLESYWTHTKGAFLHLSYLHSEDIIYPQRNALIEYSKNIFPKMELSLGIQNLKPKGVSNIYMPFTNATYYLGNHYLQLQIKPVVFQKKLEAISSTVKFNYIRNKLTLSPRFTIGKELELVAHNDTVLGLISFQEYGLRVKYKVNKTWEFYPELFFRKEHFDFSTSKNNYLVSSLVGVYSF